MFSIRLMRKRVFMSRAIRVTFITEHTHSVTKHQTNLIQFYISLFIEDIE